MLDPLSKHPRARNGAACRRWPAAFDQPDPPRESASGTVPVRNLPSALKSGDCKSARGGVIRYRNGCLNGALDALRQK
jgi:hypothetical protein